MRHWIKGLVVAVGFIAGSPAWAQAPAQPRDGSLFFNPGTSQWAFRSAGVAWICMPDGKCAQIGFDRVTPAQIAGAEITSLGFADATYYVALRHPELASGQAQIFRCTAENCVASEIPPGDATLLGTYAVVQQSRVLGRVAILARDAGATPRSHLMWCTDRACTEQPFTRDNPYDLALIGSAPVDGVNRVWLRERAGNVFRCSPADANFECVATGMNFPDPVPAVAVPPVTVPPVIIPPVAVPPVAVPPVVDQTAPAAFAMVEDAIRRGNWAEADRLILEGKTRFPREPQWGQFDRRLAQLRADRDNRARAEQARGLVADARRYAAEGDYPAAESVLQEAGRLSPNLPEIAQARIEIAGMRTERSQRLGERSQLLNAIQMALTGFRLWEADSLIADGVRRFPNDPEFRNFDNRARQMRAEEEWQRRSSRAATLVASARDAMRRRQFDDAARQLDQAERLAMGLPDIRTARFELARQRAEEAGRIAEVRQFTVDIDGALSRNQFALADVMLGNAMRRHPGEPAWPDLRRRIDVGRTAAVMPFVTNARNAMTRRDWPTADRFVIDAERTDPNAPNVRSLRADLNNQRNIAGTQATNFINAARAAMIRRDWPTADRAAASADAADPFNPNVQQLKRDLAAAKAAPSPAAALIANARTAMAAKNWPIAEGHVVNAERADPTNPAVRTVRADLNAQRNAAGLQATNFVNTARAAMTRRDWPAADAAAASANTADPTSVAVQQLLRDLAAAKAAPSPAAALIANARTAMAAKNWPVAEGHVANAERADPTNPAVRTARADLNAQRTTAGTQATNFINAARAAMTRRDWPAADAAAANANTADPTNPAVQQLLRDLTAAKAAPSPSAALIANARTAMAVKNWPVAEGHVVNAERADPTNPAVRAVRADLNAQRNAAGLQATNFINAARAAMTRRDWPTADRAAASANTADPANPAVQQLLRDLAAAKAAPSPSAALIANARTAMAAQNRPVAEVHVVNAERADPTNAAVRSVR
ncbi:MAG: hypothetical protein AB7G15_07915, partial [Alphaproteobacteria bacterium]